MLLVDAVSRIGADLPVQDILNALGETIEVSRDSTPYTWAGVCSKLLIAGIPATVVDDLITNIVAFPGGKSLNASLNSGGVDFTLASVQAGIDAIGDAMGPDGLLLAAVLKSIGIQYTTRWASFGLSGLPTEQEVIDAISAVEVRNWANTAINEIITPMVTAGNTKAEIITAIQNS